MSEEQLINQKDVSNGTSSRKDSAMSISDDSEHRTSITPMFGALHASRYSRQILIEKIQIITGKPLICYVSGHAAIIDRDDVLFLVDLLHNIPRNHDIDLLLHTPGGDIDAAEKLITILRNHVGTARLEII